MDRLLVLARAMRKSMTPYERKLWYDFLSKYSVHIVRQKIFGHYILDFYCKQAKVAIELDGSQHYGDVGKRNDAVRTKFLEEQGILVLRYSNKEIHDNFKGICMDIERVISSRISR